MKTTETDALRALHAGLYGMLYPTRKMHPEPKGEQRLLMHTADLKQVDGVTFIAEFGDETVDPNPKRCNSGYSDGVIAGLIEMGLAAEYYGEHDHYPALLLTPAGIDKVVEMFGEPTVTLPYVAHADCAPLLLRQPIV